MKNFAAAQANWDNMEPDSEEYTAYERWMDATIDGRTLEELDAPSGAILCDECNGVGGFSAEGYDDEPCKGCEKPWGLSAGEGGYILPDED